MSERLREALTGITCPRCGQPVKHQDAAVYACGSCGRWWAIQALTTQESISAALAALPTTCGKDVGVGGFTLRCNRQADHGGDCSWNRDRAALPTTTTETVPPHFHAADGDCDCYYAHLKRPNPSAPAGA